MHPTHHQPSDPTTGNVEATPGQTLRDAALYLQRHGWTQGAHYDFTADTFGPTPPACVRGAIAIACYGEAVDNPWTTDRPEQPQFTTVAAFFDDYLYLHHIHTLTDVDDDTDLCAVWWNDQPERTARQVIDVLRAAADDWDHTHGGAQ